MAKDKYSPRKRKPNTAQVQCFLCKQSIEPGADYYFLKVKRGPYRYIHPACWEEHKTGAWWKEEHEND